MIHSSKQELAKAEVNKKLTDNTISQHAMLSCETYVR